MVLNTLHMISNIVKYWSSCRRTINDMCKIISIYFNLSHFSLFCLFVRLFFMVPYFLVPYFLGFPIFLVSYILVSYLLVPYFLVPYIPTTQKYNYFKCICDWSLDREDFWNMLIKVTKTSMRWLYTAGRLGQWWRHF